MGLQAGGDLGGLGGGGLRVEGREARGGFGGGEGGVVVGLAHGLLFWFCRLCGGGGVLVVFLLVKVWLWL